MAASSKRGMGSVIAPAMAVVVLATATVSANAIDPNAPPRFSFLGPEPGFGKQIARLLIPFLLTFSVEVPIVAFLLRGSLPVAVGAITGLAVSAISYPLAFYLYWRRHWGITPLELTVMALESLLLLGASGAASRLNLALSSPTLARLVSTAVISNLASWLVGKVFLG